MPSVITFSCSVTVNILVANEMMCCDWLIMIVVVNENAFIDTQEGQTGEFRKRKLAEVKHNSTETEALARHIVQIKYRALCMLYSPVSIHLVTSGCKIVKICRRMIPNPDGQITIAVYLFSSLSHSLSANGIQ